MIKAHSDNYSIKLNAQNAINRMRVGKMEAPVVVSVASEGYTMSLSVTLCSALMNLKKYDKLQVFIIDGGLTKDDKAKIEDSLNPSKVDIAWVKPKQDIVNRMKGLHQKDWLNHLTYFRLLIPNLLPDYVQKVIYVDSDTVVKEDLGQLWDMDMDNHTIMAAQNLDWQVSSARGLSNYKELGISPGNKYFNTGVMVMDLKKWRAENISEKVIAYVQKNKEILRWCDQDGLNAILADKWKEIDPLWNYEVVVNPYDENKIEKSKIIHYTGPRKPWHYKFEHPAKDVFFEYLDMTAWSGWRPKKPFHLMQLVVDLTRPLRKLLGLQRSQIIKLKDILKNFEVKWRFQTHLSIKERKDLPHLLNALNLTGIGVEVGVFHGRYSKYILQKSQLKTLYSIDPWREFDKKEYNDLTNVTQDEQYEGYITTIKKLAKFKNRSKILRTTSADSAKMFKDGSLDFVYIDAQHNYESVKQDICLWWSKLKKGGIFAGHDYLNGQLREGEFGVKKAVDEFVRRGKFKLYVTKEKWPTWYLRKV